MGTGNGQDIHLDDRAGLAGRCGDGIILPAGGAPLLVQAFVALTILRSELRSTVPVELVYVGREELPRPTQ